jgi:hypothetical protein
MLDKVSNDKADWSGDSCKAMHHNVGGFESLSNKGVALIKILSEIEAFSILSRYLQVERNLFDGVV